MHSSSPRVTLACLLSLATAGCVYDSLNEALIQSKASRSGVIYNTLLTGASVFQRAIIAIANGVSRELAAQIDGGGTLAAPFTGTGLPAVTGRVDFATGLGALASEPGAERPLALAFTFTVASIDKGKLVQITTTKGHLDGYAIYFSRLAFTYLPRFDETGRPAKDAKGNFQFDVFVAGEGAIGIGDQERVKLTAADFAVGYPALDGKHDLGHLDVASPTGDTMSIQYKLNAHQLTGSGSLKDAQGFRLLAVTSGHNNAVARRSVSPPRLSAHLREVKKALQ
jgi:hypothetical protein